MADVTDAAAVTDMVAAMSAVHGPIDILVNNAGIPAGGLPLTEFADSSIETWDEIMRININGVLNCTHAVLPSMTARGWGRVVTITSDSGRTGEPQLAPYAASKAAAAAFMRSLAKEVGASGVTCNSLSLGTVLPEEHHLSTEDYERHARRYAVRRLGRPADVAAAVVWLASEEGGWVTGQTIPVNGGYATS
ncbi:short-chain dehydrogenase/reductase SDR [Rhodococcus ruber BKS 20-38]|uniref:Short-chain dehydrogenase/reductase SDR n=1 Tax=Rhodococcus ruber BKS 20-38 TaxID=1278076 RepID=M2ZJ44_9NOCA|nr:short-chain dehydrogenase/reductase SDR [Rhodococcus ruber BKS 20-38]